MHDGSVWQKALFSVLLCGLPEVIVWQPITLSCLQSLHASRIAACFSLLVTPCSITQCLLEFVEGDCRISKPKWGLPSLPPLLAPSVPAARKAAWEPWLLLQIMTILGTIAQGKKGSRGNIMELCRCWYIILSLSRIEFLNGSMKVSCYGNQHSQLLYLRVRIVCGSFLFGNIYSGFNE